MDKVELAGSLVAQCWSSFVDESEKIVRVVKEGFMVIYLIKNAYFSPIKHYIRQLFVEFQYNVPTLYPPRGWRGKIQKIILPVLTAMK